MDELTQLKRQLSKLANLAQDLDRQLVTRDDGVLESMYTYESQRVKDALDEAVQETWIMLGAVVEGEQCQAKSK